MAPTCSFCGEEYPTGRLACPHCGSDDETGWRPEGSSEGLDLPSEMDEEEYGRFLEEEGLAAREGGIDVHPGAIILALFALAVAVALAVLVF